jgi:hypothetical protein
MQLPGSYRVIRSKEAQNINDKSRYNLLESTYVGRCGNSCVTEYAELGLPPPGKTGRPEASHSHMPLRIFFFIGKY